MGRDRALAAVSVAGGRTVAARSGAWIVFADECGQTLRAHKATAWAPKGETPVVKVTAKGTVRSPGCAAVGPATAPG